MKGIIGTLVVIFIMISRDTECKPVVTMTESCLQFNRSYSQALTDTLSPLYLEINEELISKIDDAGYESLFQIEYYKSYDGKVLAYIRVRPKLTKIGKVDGIEEDLTKVGLNVWSLNTSCGCEVCRKWSEWYPCPKGDHLGDQCRCRHNLCVQRNCDPQREKINCTGNSITKKADDSPTRPMTNITNRDQKDKNSNTHEADNSWTTPKSNIGNTDQNCPGLQDHCYSLVDIIVAVVITIVVVLSPIFIVIVCKWCAKNNRREGEHQSNRNPNTPEESNIDLELSEQEGINSNLDTKITTEPIEATS